jgi:hypothetical protein
MIGTPRDVKCRHKSTADTGPGILKSVRTMDGGEAAAWAKASAPSEAGHTLKPETLSHAAYISRLSSWSSTSNTVGVNIVT